MPIDVSHFSMVGFPIDMSDGATAMRTAAPYLEKCNPKPIAAMDLVCVVKDKSGAELALGLRSHPDRTVSIETINPSFAGEARAKIEIVADASDPEWRPFENTLSARFAGADQPPLIFDLADPKQMRLVRPGAKLTADIAAFSFEPEIFADEAAYYAAQAKEKVTFSSDVFIPSGMFGTEKTRPEPHAFLAGMVLKVEMRANEAGNARFWWALVKSYGGATFNVVMDPTTVKAEPKVGSIIAGEFWLTAHIVE